MANERLDFNIDVHDRGAESGFSRLANRLEGVNRKMVDAARSAREYAGVSEKLSRVRDREADALDRVGIAEANLSEIRSKSTAKTSQILRAESQLAKARRDAARATGDVARAIERAATPDGQSSAKNYISGFHQWITGAGGKDLHDAGKFGGSVFGSGFLGALRTPGLGPALVVAFSAVAASVLPEAGAIAGGAVVAGFGAGLAGLAIVFASKAQRVRDAWKTTLSGMGADMTILSRPFESTLVSLANVASRTFGRFKPELKASFADLAPAVAVFADQLGRAFEKLAPAVKPMADAFAAVLRATGPAMQDALGNMSDGMVRLANSVKQNPQGLADLTRGVGSLSGSLLGAIASLNDFNGGVSRLTGGTSAMDLALGHSNSLIGDVWQTARKAINPFQGLSDTFHALTHTGNSAAIATAAQANATSKAVKPAETLTDKINRQTSATDQLISTMFRMQNLALGLSGSEITYRQSIADATQSVRDNGKNLDLNTAKGRANKTALNNLAQSANDVTAGMLRAGRGTAAASQAAQASRAQFIGMAEKMGLSKAAAKRLADQVLLTQRQINAMHGKNVPITYTMNGTNFTLNTRTPSRVGGLAGGGPVSGPGSGTSDRAGVFALSNNEYVVKAASAQKYGQKAMSSVNSGTAMVVPGMAAGGAVNIHGTGVFKDQAQLRKVLGAGFAPAVSSAAGAGAGVERWRGVALAALAAAHEPASWIGSLLRRMNQESGGNPRAINLWDSNAKRGMPSQGLMQTVPGTFAAYAGPYRGRGIYDPFANIYAAIKYTVARYGSGPAGWNRPGGYKNGGWLMPGQTAYNETRKPEAVFNQSQLASMGRRSQEVNINVNGTVLDSRTVDQIISEIRKRVWTHSNDVHAVFARSGRRPGRR
ncbi:transglycosylase-like protein with SLT domain [Kribbella rubisoli]|uniref:Transglycosylase-like protein with SLT domain n=1 Tax=Kribbella rubisoli TaxID=3075929 RepID=A0A4Q7WRC2_9ACTN|nr:transglycosylase SLT domain-containing protein [Kribbella rubisoli]RZU12448.1 transglycosylase-like protein with SLT domain [Kribbella rubisoli]